MLIAAPLDYEQPALGSGWFAILSYPRLFVAGLIWMTILNRLRNDRLRVGYR